MNVLGVGTDIASVDRFAGILERTGERFLARCFRPGERRDIRGGDAAAGAAARWAAKEAFLKALGRPVGHIPYQDVEVESSAEGTATLCLHGLARREAEACGVERMHLSLSHDGGHAVALVVLESLV